VRIRAARFDAQALKGLEHLVATLNARAPMPQHAKIVADLLQSIREDSAGRLPIVHRKVTYLKGLLLAGQGQPVSAMPYMTRSFELYRSVDSGLRMVSDLAVLGHYEQALEMLSLSEALLAKEGASDAHFSEATYRSESHRLRAALLEDLERRGLEHDHVE
jgi:hypothetical protein